jgi:hypothetical protein
MTGADLKAEGQQLALEFSGDWRDLVVAEFRAWASAEREKGLGETTIERFRAAAKHQPASHKAWGALPGVLCRKGLIEPTGRYVKAVSPRTHAHPVQLWRVVAA